MKIVRPHAKRLRAAVAMFAAALGSFALLAALLSVILGLDSRVEFGARTGDASRITAILNPLRVVEAAARPAANSIFAKDKGKFRIVVNGQQAGTEEFEIAPSGDNWVAHGTSEVQSPQGPTHVHGTLELRADGTPLHYEWTTQGAKKAGATIVFNGNTASVELRLEGMRPFSQTFTFGSARVAVLDNNLYHQYDVLARLYDWNQKGAQTFSVLVPQEMTPGTVTVESLGKQEVAGQKLEQLRVKTEDLEIELFLDGPHLRRVVSPSANAEIIRE
jgi:hypothetical protein